jgi:hypothetical protein
MQAKDDLTGRELRMASQSLSLRSSEGRTGVGEW